MKRALFSVIIALTTLNAAFGQAPGDKERVYSVPDINGRATLLVQPEIPSDVSLRTDGNTLIVKIVVDANGNVVSAKCSQDCPKVTTAPAEAAAMASKFRPLIVGGQAVKYDGTLMYTIAMEKVNWYRFALALQSTYIFDNLSLGPVAAMLTNEFAGERSKLQDLDQRVELAVRWKTIEGVRNSIRGKLQSRDAWWFDLGFAMREVTSPFQSDKKLDLSEVQAAISNLAKFVDAAPSDVLPSTLENLRALATYKINPAMPPQEVRQAIFKLASGIRP
ncbi:MAG TPA: hypothetical protein VF556_08810 [Pyrinomonadaceae bacterium]|jgi:hypothetical protein